MAHSRSHTAPLQPRAGRTVGGLRLVACAADSRRAVRATSDENEFATTIDYTYR